MKKLIIAGSRTFKDYAYLRTTLDLFLKEEYIIVSGGANGADKLGEQYANERGWQIEQHLAKWDDLSEKPCKVKVNSYGKQYNSLAGYNRNKKMLESLKENLDGGMLIAFWDGQSRGTKDMIDKCISQNIPTKVFETV